MSRLRVSVCSVLLLLACGGSGHTPADIPRSALTAIMQEIAGDPRLALCRRGDHGNAEEARLLVIIESETLPLYPFSVVAPDDRQQEAQTLTARCVREFVPRKVGLMGSTIEASHQGVKVVARIGRTLSGEDEFDSGPAVSVSFSNPVDTPFEIRGRSGIGLFAVVDAVGPDDLNLGRYSFWIDLSPVGGDQWQATSAVSIDQGSLL